MKKICIVTTRHISYNPRVLKEADTLYRMGYQIKVVTINNHVLQRRFDEELMQSRKWSLVTVNYRREFASEKALWLLLTLKQRFYNFFSRLIWRYGIAERALNKAYDQLLRLAIQAKADLYIVHHPEALGIGYAAAKANHARFAFDAEDFHSGMHKRNEKSHEDALIYYLESKYLPLCDYVTAASKGIADAYASTYSIATPAIILNVFTQQSLAPKSVQNKVVKFYWYSQVIGPHRNLEYLMHAASVIVQPFEIHLRGSFHNKEYEEQLTSLIRQLGLKEKVFFHPPILAEQIIDDASHYDVGLALESKVSVNRDICVTNKIFAYLMAGLVIIGTDTQGQRDIFSRFPIASQLCDMNDPLSLSKAMSFYILNKDILLDAQQAARKAALEEFNWEAESQKFFYCITSILSGNVAPNKQKSVAASKKSSLV